MSLVKKDNRIQLIYHDLLVLCKPFIRKNEGKVLRDAFDLVLKFHQPGWEKTRVEYLYHSIEVAKIVIKELNLGVTSVVCALLHNVVDDKTVTIDDIRKQFGTEVAVIVDGYAKLSELQTEKISVHSDNFRKLYLSLIGDIRVILIKLAHRLFDLRNFNKLDEQRKQRFLTEANHIYIPIAHRLGLYAAKSELEELWMKYSYPEVYRSIAQKMKDSHTKQKVYIEEFIDPIEKELFKSGYDFEIKGRPKSIHSIWRKMKRQNVDFEEVYDLFAIRIILNSKGKNEKPDCWKVYSIVSDKYQPNPKRLRDWISTPKASGYESLHTTVVGPRGKWVEVQIRTRRMDDMAEKGLAAHWRYKEGSAKKEQEEWMTKIRDVIENPDAETAMAKKLSKIELYSDKIFIFTPEGDLKKLPVGSTVLDFAYMIHTRVGDMCSGARVNNKIVPIRYVLNNGEKVEIITSNNQNPKQDWLNFVVTPRAKAKIKRALNEEKYREAELGKEILRRKLRNRKIQFTDVVIDRLIKEYKLKSSIDLYYLIAIEKIDLTDIKRAISEDTNENHVETDQNAIRQKTNYRSEPSDDFMLIDTDIDSLDYELAKCCHPISGDAVFGFVTVGKGITIHRLNCPNAKQLLEKYDYRIIDVKWRKTDANKTYLTTIQVKGSDEVGILNNITRVISEDFKVNMVSAQVDSHEAGLFNGKFKVSVKDLKHLEMITKKIMKVKGVDKVRRLEIEE
jgi:GTP pyrophosphokinase